MGKKDGRGIRINKKTGSVMFASYEENKINGHFVNIKADGTVEKGT
jgi:hypothetical protein